MKDSYILCRLEPVLRITSLCTAFSVVYGADFAYDGEAHDFYEAVFVLQGEAGIVAGDEVLCLHAGQMVIHPPMEFHRIWNAADTSLKFLVLSFGADAFPINEHRVCAFTAKQGEDMKDEIEVIRRHFTMNGSRLLEPRGAESLSPIQTAVNNIENLLLTLLGRGDVSDIDDTRSARRYSDVVALMRRNLDRRLNVDELATMAKMSRSALQKMFCRYAGMGVIKFYTQLQVMRAQNLLEAGMSVKEVALALGFDDQNYFSRLFRRFTGEPPSAFRPRK